MRLGKLSVSLLKKDGLKKALNGGVIGVLIIKGDTKLKQSYISRKESEPCVLKYIFGTLLQRTILGNP